MKLLFDITVSFLALVVFAPAFLICAIALKSEERDAPP